MLTVKKRFLTSAFSQQQVFKQEILEIADLIKLKIEFLFGYSPFTR